jgi:hypothetical protein
VRRVRRVVLFAQNPLDDDLVVVVISRGGRASVERHGADRVAAEAHAGLDRKLSTPEARSEHFRRMGLVRELQRSEVDHVVDLETVERPETAEPEVSASGPVRVQIAWNRTACRG